MLRPIYAKTNVLARILNHQINADASGNTSRRWIQSWITFLAHVNRNSSIHQFICCASFERQQHMLWLLYIYKFNTQFYCFIYSLSSTDCQQEMTKLYPINILTQLSMLDTLSHSQTFQLSKLPKNLTVICVLKA